MSKVPTYPRRCRCGDTAHLDVAWLWTYAQARRKAARTFANALALIERRSGLRLRAEPAAIVRVRAQTTDPPLFERVARRVRRRALRRFRRRACGSSRTAIFRRESRCCGKCCSRTASASERFGVEPSIAWLPDTFGFARTLADAARPRRHPRFGTTKLQWNDTTRFPHRPVRLARAGRRRSASGASIDRMEGRCAAKRVRVARERNEPLIVGYGDGGGGPTRRICARRSTSGTWERPPRWFDRLDERRGAPPVHDDELYLEYHRGVYTTHHDVKAANAGLERAARTRRRAAAWCVAVRAPREAVERVRAQLRDAWEIVLRNQFHDVLPGTSIARSLRGGARRVRARERATRAASTPSARRCCRAPQTPPRDDQLVAPVATMTAASSTTASFARRSLRTGTIVEIAVPAALATSVAQANLLALYPDRPRKWEAWNLDSGFEQRRRTRRAAAAGCASSTGRSRCGLRSETLAGHDARRRCMRASRSCASSWRSTWTRAAPDSAFGELAGLRAATRNLRRPARHRGTQRAPRHAARARAFRSSGPTLCHRARRRCWPCGSGARHLRLERARAAPWRLAARAFAAARHHVAGSEQPMPGAQHLRWAFAPLAGSRIGAIERRVGALREASRRCGCSRATTTALAVAACKPAEDGDGAIVRMREMRRARREWPRSLRRARARSRMPSTGSSAPSGRGADRGRGDRGDDSGFWSARLSCKILA